MKEKDVNFASKYELACWPDDLRGTGLTLFNGWHFSDNPLYDGISPSDATFVPSPKHNVTYIVDETLKIFKQSGITFYKSLMLRFFIHLVGDMHQPLHMTTRVTQQHKDGDRGGNLFVLQGTPNNLHSLWDQVMGKTPVVKRVFLFDEQQPVDSAGEKTIEQWATDITRQFTRQSLARELAIKDVKTMSLMIHRYAQTDVYKDIAEHTKPTDNYKNSRAELCKMLMALAGYRLADFLNLNL